MTKAEIFMQTHNPKQLHFEKPKLCTNIVNVIYDKDGVEIDWKWNCDYINGLNETVINKMENVFAPYKLGKKVVEGELNETAKNALYVAFEEKRVENTFSLDKTQFDAFIDEMLPIFTAKTAENGRAILPVEVSEKSLNLAVESFRKHFNFLMKCAKNVEEAKMYFNQVLDDIYKLYYIKYKCLEVKKNE